MFAEEFVDEVPDIERGVVVNFLLHVPYCNDLHTGVGILDIFEHLRDFLVDVLILVNDKYIIMPDRNMSFEEPRNLLALTDILNAVAIEHL